MSDCLSEDTIVSLLEGRLDGMGVDRATAHLDTCAACRELIAEAARAPWPDAAAESRPSGAPLARGASVGRYVIRAPVGAGSMGTVYAAYDPELDREVALKLLRADALAAHPAAELGARLRREAHALARLSHPNVITVYDAGTIDGEVFVAMEFVDGGTLAGWLHAEPRKVPEIVDVFQQAGEGLAAAHEAGIVHRDFKPENVLIGRDGRVRVTDFGLARTPSASPRRHADAPSVESVTTRTGVLVGTPAYMAPEQWEGLPSDARSDVFAFCVALFEAIAGERPFAGMNLESLMQAVRDERVSPSVRRLPRWLRRIVLRGLYTNPAARWPAMRPLLDALAKGPLLTPRGIGAATLAIALASVLLWAFGRSNAALCRGAEGAWGDVFGAAQRDATRHAFERSGRPSSAHAFAQVERAFADYGKAWIAMRTDACAATRVRGEQSETLLDLRMACLDDRRREAAALARLFASADAKLVDRWSSALGGLVALDGCANARALVAPAPVPTDPHAKKQLEDVSTQLAEAKALNWTAQYRRALEIAKPAAEAAMGLGALPLAARLELVQGDAEHRLSELDAAASHLHAAAALALEARDDATAADAWILLVRIDGSLRASRPEGERWGRYAEAALRRIGGDDEREAMLLRNLGTLPVGEGYAEQSRQQLLRARALYDKSREPQRTFYLAGVDETLAHALYFDGHVEEALAIHRRVEAARVALLGPDHLGVAASLDNEADCLMVLGRLDEALALLRRSLAAADHPYAHQRLAEALRRRGDPAGALEEDRRALAVLEQGGPSLHLDDGRVGEGLDLLALGRAAEAIGPLEAALPGRERMAALPHYLADTRFALARALFASGGDRVRAQQLCVAARDAYRPLAERHGSFYRAALDDIERFLATVK
jgi:tetratricopeptide (TPR) repeat protein